MRILLSFTLAALVLTPPMVAQQFEGTFTMRVGGPGGTGAMISKITTKGDRVLNIIALPGMAQEMRTIIDNHAGTITTLTPFPPRMTKPQGVANAKGVIAVRPLPSLGAGTTGAPPHSDIRALGTSQAIAGIQCNDYEATSETGQTVRMCLTSALGRLTTGAMGGAASGDQPAPWAAALGNKPMIPLKIWRTNGVTILEVVEIKRHPVSLHAFDIPPGYIDMATALKNRTSVPKP